MTNKERLCALPSGKFYSKVKKIVNNQLSKYIDYEKYFDSEDEDIGHFIKYKERCTLRPSEAEIAVRKSNGEKITDEWINSRLIKGCLLLDIVKVFDTDYANVGVPDEIEGWRIIKTPMTSVIRESSFSQEE